MGDTVPSGVYPEQSEELLPETKKAVKENTLTALGFVQTSNAEIRPRFFT
jgi:hypothetical protein